MSDIERAKTPQQQFEDTINERLRKDIGSLMPDEVLSGLIEKAIHEAFFKEKHIPSNGWQSPARTEPSVVVTQIKELLDERVKELVQAYLVENRETLVAMIDESIKQGLAETVIRYLSSKVEDVASVIAKMSITAAFPDLVT